MFFTRFNFCFISIAIIQIANISLADINASDLDTIESLLRNISSYTEILNTALAPVPNDVGYISDVAGLFDELGNAPYSVENPAQWDGGSALWAIIKGFGLNNLVGGDIRPEPESDSYYRKLFGYRDTNLIGDYSERSIMGILLHLLYQTMGDTGFNELDRYGFGIQDSGITNSLHAQVTRAADYQQLTYEYITNNIPNLKNAASSNIQYLDTVLDNLLYLNNPDYDFDNEGYFELPFTASTMENIIHDLPLNLRNVGMSSTNPLKPYEESLNSFGTGFEWIYDYVAPQFAIRSSGSSRNNTFGDYRYLMYGQLPTFLAFTEFVEDYKKQLEDDADDAEDAEDSVSNDEIEEPEIPEYKGEKASQWENYWKFDSMEDDLNTPIFSSDASNPFDVFSEKYKDIRETQEKKFTYAFNMSLGETDIQIEKEIEIADENTLEVTKYFRLIVYFLKIAFVIMLTVQGFSIVNTALS